MKSKTAASLGAAILITTAPARAQHGDALPERRGALVHMGLGAGMRELTANPSWERQFGPVATVLVGGTVAPWLIVGGGVTLGVFPGQYDTATVGVIGPFVQAWLDRNQGLYVQASAGVAHATRDHAAHAGLGLGLAAGFEGRIGRVWSVGPAFQFLYAGKTYEQDCDHGCGGRSKQLDQVLFAFALGVTYQ